MTIRIGRTRLKIFNCLIFLIVIALIIYLIIFGIFKLPIFNSEYKNSIVYSNYSVDTTIKFKHQWFMCHVKEIYKINSGDKLIKEELKNDLLNDGYKKKGKYLIKKYTYKGFCKDDRKKYIDTVKNTNFELNGKDNIKLTYKDEFKDPYVTLKYNGKKNKNININTNYNGNKLGTYIIKYETNTSNYYKIRLYRKIAIIDKEKPELTLEGDEEEIEYGKNFVELGYKATDNYDGNITKKVVVKNTINNKKPGTYKVVYTVKDTSGNKTTKSRMVTVKEKVKEVSKQQPTVEVKNGITYVNGILLVNKKYSLPKDYDPKVNEEALSKLKEMQADAKVLGLSLPLVSGYRSYKTQEALYNKYVKKDGEKLANTYSAKPGQSEHQTGLAFDIGRVDSSFANTDEAKWIANNCYKYGFIIRYPKDKTDITGYIYEAWHVRYLGIDTATKVYQSGLTLEEYLGIN